MKPIFSYGTSTRSDVPLTCWAEVRRDGEVIAKATFVVDEKDAVDAGYWFHPKGLAMKQASDWAKETLDRVKKETFHSA